LCARVLAAGPILCCPSLGCPGAAVAPRDGPTFELPVTGMWCHPSRAEPQGVVEAIGGVSRGRRDGRVVVAQPPSLRVEWSSSSPQARGPSSSHCLPAPEREGRVYRPVPADENRRTTVCGAKNTNSKETTLDNTQREF
jgi:hypothetical protein